MGGLEALKEGEGKVGGVSEEFLDEMEEEKELDDDVQEEGVGVDG